MLANHQNVGNEMILVNYLLCIIAVADEMLHYRAMFAKYNIPVFFSQNRQSTENSLQASGATIDSALRAPLLR